MGLYNSASASSPAGFREASGRSFRQILATQQSVCSQKDLKRNPMSKGAQSTSCDNLHLALVREKDLWVEFAPDASF
jgi:hypothetical protein